MNEGPTPYNRRVLAPWRRVRYFAVVDPRIARLDIFGVPLATLTAEAALAEAERLLQDPAPRSVVHVNAHTANLAYDDVAYRAVLARAGMVCNDGKGMLLAARLLGTRFPADLNGNYLGPRLLERAADRGWKVFFFGARPGVAARAAERLTARIPRLQICGVRDGYVAPHELEDVLAGIAAAGPDMIFVGLGNPQQEVWLDTNLAATGAPLGVGVGAFFDFQAGEIQRAPGWMNRLGLEWVHRLFKEPKRMWRRYVYGNPRFLYRVMRQRVAERAAQTRPRN